MVEETLGTVLDGGRVCSWRLCGTELDVELPLGFLESALPTVFFAQFKIRLLVFIDTVVSQGPRGGFEGPGPPDERPNVSTRRSESSYKNSLADITFLSCIRWDGVLVERYAHE